MKLPRLTVTTDAGRAVLAFLGREYPAHEVAARISDPGTGHLRATAPDGDDEDVMLWYLWRVARWNAGLGEGCPLEEWPEVALWLGERGLRVPPLDVRSGPGSECFTVVERRADEALLRLGRDPMAGTRRWLEEEGLVW